MTSITTPLEEAEWVYRHAAQYDRQQRFDAAVSLGEWGLFSFRQIGAIVGMSHTSVRKIVAAKTNKTGGKFDPACLTALLDIVKRRRQGETVPPDEVRDMLAAGSGTSPYVASKLSGLSESYYRRRKE